MNSKNFTFSGLTLKSLILLSSLLICNGLTIGELELSANAQLLSNAEREELSRLRTETKIQKQLQSYLSIWLTLLSLFAVGLIATLWFLRKAIIRDIVERAMRQIGNIENLQTELIAANQKTTGLIEYSQDLALELEQKVNHLKTTIEGEGGKLSVLLSDLPKSKQEFLTALEREVIAAQENISSLEFKLNTQLEQVTLAAQQQRVTIENVKKLESELFAQFSEIKLSIENHRDTSVSDINKYRSELMEQFEILALETLESKTQVVQSITEHASQFTSGLSDFQTHAQEQMDGFTSGLSDFQTHAQEQMDGFTSDLSEFQTHAQEQMDGFTSDLSEFQTH
ncbi:MAG: hypothetical protein IV298_07485, partial [Cylindrospermopsis raciborskii KL1]|nr:hypothetical protein [Cylindrospermopsis raciborskii KL1]